MPLQNMTYHWIANDVQHDVCH